MSYRVIRTDRRHAASNEFDFYIEMNYTPDVIERHLKYLEYRNYCWTTWGPSAERDHYLLLAKRDLQPNQHWAWHTVDTIKRIYFKTEQEFSWFHLRWS